MTDDSRQGGAFPASFLQASSARENTIFPSSWAGVLLISTSAAGFSTLAIFAKLAYDFELNLPSILMFRFLGTAIIIWGWLLLRNNWQIPLGQAIRAVLLGSIGYAIQATLFFSALLHTGAGVATLLFYTYPAFVTLLAWAIDKDVPDRARKIALAIAFIGCVLTADLSQATVAPLGIVFGVASGAWYSLYLTFGARLVRNIQPTVTSAYVSLGATVSFAIATLAASQLTLPNSIQGVYTLLGIAVLATALPIVTLFSGMQKIGTTRAAIVSTIEPVMTVLLGFFFLGEHLAGAQVWGGLLVVVSVVLANL